MFSLSASAAVIKVMVVIEKSSLKNRLREKLDNIVVFASVFNMEITKAIEELL